MSQIALPLSFDRQFSFDNFLTDTSDFIGTSLRGLIDGSTVDNVVGLWGYADSGKTHLLNASALYAREMGEVLQLYEAAQLLEYNPEQVGDMVSTSILAVDNLDVVCGRRKWEEKFYRVINQCRNEGFRFLFTLSNKPQLLECELEDFKSRLSWGLLLELPRADDDSIRRIVNMRARLLGIELSNEVLSYLLTHFPRRLSDQIVILRQLDKASLSAKKKVTIPLIKQVLADSSDE